LPTILNFFLVSLSHGAAMVEQVNISRDEKRLIMLLDSNVPIQSKFETKKGGQHIVWSLKGADYYQALTDYFTVFDIDSLVDCLDNLVIAPETKTSARFEAELGKGLTASAIEGTSPSGSYRVMMQLTASKDAPCFSRPIPNSLVAAEGLFAKPTSPDVAAPPVNLPSTMSPAAAAAMASASPPSEAQRELTAEEIVKAQEQERKKQLEAQKKERRLAGLASESEVQEHFEKQVSENQYVLNADILFDNLNYTNKGGLKGDNWLQKYGDSELREMDAGIANEQALFPYHVSMQSFKRYVNEDGDRVDEQKAVINRAWIGYRFTAAATIKAGIMYEPSSSDASSDLSALPFLEHGLSSALSPQYNPGVMFSYHSRSLELELGGFGKRSDLPDTTQSSSLRLAYRAPTSAYSVAIFDVSYNKAKLVDDTLAIAPSPEANLIVPNLYVALQTNVDSITRSCFGANWIFHGVNYSAQVAELEADTENPGIRKLSSKNLWVTWYSGSNSRQLLGSKWLPVRSLKSMSEIDWKSWELGFRYSALEDNTEEHLITKTLMLNWYINKYVTLKNNYIFATQVASPNNPLVPIDNDADLFVTRVQVSW